MKVLLQSFVLAGLVTGCLVPLDAAKADAGLAVTGLIAHPSHLSLADLRAMPSLHVTVAQLSGRGPVALDCTGPTVATLLSRAAPDFGTAKNAFLAHTLLFTADDSYAVALSFGEFDPDYGKATPIIATDCGGKPLAAPRLVVPSDLHGGRAVNGVVSMEIK
jgi:hypothetical protein